MACSGIYAPLRARSQVPMCKVKYASKQNAHRNFVYHIHGRGGRIATDSWGAVMRQVTALLSVQTERQGLLEITRRIIDWTNVQDVHEGLLTIFCRHTSASLLIQENAAPEVRSDLETFFARIAPEDPDLYTHDDEGTDDMPAHLRTALTQVQLTIPLIGGQLALGTWQGIYLFEHRRRPHTRTLALHLIGERK